MPQPTWSIDDVPDKPGVYVFRDARGKALYVGKARRLKTRLRSYRRPGGDGRLLLRFLESRATRVETIVTRTEQEALLLEDALIKDHKPPHNIRLKDDKSFLMLRLDDEPFPRLKFVRAHRPNAERTAGGRSRFFGPFASAGAVRRTLSDLHRVIPLRDCPDAIFRHRSRPCIKHQIGLCSAPCVGLVSPEDYAELVERAARVLAGDTGELEGELEQRMEAAAQELQYERAAMWRDRLAALRRTVERQGVKPPDRVERDVLALARSGPQAVVHRIAFREGRMTESRSHLFRSELPDEELWHDVVTALYGPGRGPGRRGVPREIVLGALPAERELLEGTLGEGVRLVVPLRGARRRMLDLAVENARATLARREREKAAEELGLVELERIADLPRPPEVIDGFDVSNLQGTHVVASRVRFRSGHPDKTGYRRFKVRDLEGQDDFAAMRQVVARSLKRCVRDGELPDLIVIDGGAQQLASALEAREEAGAWDVPVVGLAKARAERTVGGRRKAASEERLFLEGALEALELLRHGAARRLLERVRDEAHRFAITYHRKERGRIRSQLDSIPGLGPVKRKRLLRKFGSVAGVREASVEEIAAVTGIGGRLAGVIRKCLEGEMGG